MDYTELVEEAKKLAGVRDDRKILFSDSIQCLKEPEKARELILDFATPTLGTGYTKSESPWTDNFGDTEMLTVPVIYINGKIANRICYLYEQTIEYALENLNLDEYEKQNLESRLEIMLNHEKEYERMVGY
jgi:hypothetical protein